MPESRVSEAEIAPVGAISMPYIGRSFGVETASSNAPRSTVTARLLATIGRGSQESGNPVFHRLRIASESPLRVSPSLGLAACGMVHHVLGGHVGRVSNRPAFVLIRPGSFLRFPLRLDRRSLQGSLAIGLGPSAVAVLTDPVLHPFPTVMQQMAAGWTVRGYLGRSSDVGVHG